MEIPYKDVGQRLKNKSNRIVLLVFSYLPVSLSQIASSVQGSCPGHQAPCLSMHQFPSRGNQAGQKTMHTSCHFNTDSGGNLAYPVTKPYISKYYFPFSFVEHLIIFFFSLFFFLVGVDDGEKVGSNPDAEILPATFLFCFRGWPH